LDFKNFEFLTVGRVDRTNLRGLAKFRGDRPNCCGDMTIYLFSNMAAVPHLGFVVRAILQVWLENAYSGPICCFWEGAFGGTFHPNNVTYRPRPKKDRPWVELEP